MGILFKVNIYIGKAKLTAMENYYINISGSKATAGNLASSRFSKWMFYKHNKTNTCLKEFKVLWERFSESRRILLMFLDSEKMS